MTKNDSINDLYDYGYKIIQNESYFKFSLDSILLADFIHIDFKDKQVLDLCTGNAPIPLILSKNTNLNIYGFEIQNEIFNLAINSIKINKINNVKIINDDINNWQNYFPGNNFDVISCNPPYFKMNNKSIINKNIVKAIARHEIKIKLEEIIKISADLLRSKGKLYLVYRTERLIELLYLLKKYQFGIKRLQCAHSKLDKECSLVLVEAKKDSKDNMIILPPIITDNYRGDL